MIFLNFFVIFDINTSKSSKNTKINQFDTFSNKNTFKKYQECMLESDRVCFFKMFFVWKYIKIIFFIFLNLLFTSIYQSNLKPWKNQFRN